MKFDDIKVRELHHTPNRIELRAEFKYSEFKSIPLNTNEDLKEIQKFQLQESIYEKYQFLENMFEIKELLKKLSTCGLTFVAIADIVREANRYV